MRVEVAIFWKPIGQHSVLGSVNSSHFGKITPGRASLAMACVSSSTVGNCPRCPTLPPLARRSVKHVSWNVGAL